MNILKGIGLGFFGFLLFVALPVMVLGFTVNSTFLNPHFVNQEIQKLDIPAVVHETLADRTTSAQEHIFISGIDQTVTRIKPWLDIQIELVVNAGYDYLLSRTPELDVTIPSAEIEQTLLDSLTASYLQNPPPEYSSLPKIQQGPYIANLQNQFSDSFPATVEINSGTIGDDGMQALRQARDVVGYIRTAYFGLIGICVFLALLIVLILRNLKDIARTFGLIFLINGLILTAVFLIIRAVVPGLINYGDFPAHVQTWIPQVIRDLLSPFGIFSICLLVIGVTLFVTSFLIKQKRKASISG